MKIVAEKEKAYLLKEGKVVQAFKIEDINAPVEETQEETFKLGSRVAHKDKSGTVTTEDVSMYGPFFGIKFDDGSLGEYEASDLTSSAAPEPNFDTPVDELKSEWSEYQELPQNTLEQIEAKASIARSLNLRAKALKSEKKTAFSDSVLLDKVAVATDVDILDFAHLSSILPDEEKDYLEGLPNKRAMYESLKSASDEDTGWIVDIGVGEERNWDSELTTLASNIVEKFDVEDLENEAFVRQAVDHQIDYLALDEDQQNYLRSAVKEASAEKCSEPVIKTASTEEVPEIDLETYDATELFDV